MCCRTAPPLLDTVEFASQCSLSYSRHYSPCPQDPTAHHHVFIHNKALSGFNFRSSCASTKAIIMGFSFRIPSSSTKAISGLSFRTPSTSAKAFSCFSFRTPFAGTKFYTAAFKFCTTHNLVQRTQSTGWRHVRYFFTMRYVLSRGGVQFGPSLTVF